MHIHVQMCICIYIYIYICRVRVQMLRATTAHPVQSRARHLVTGLGEGGGVLLAAQPDLAGLART